TTGPSTGALSYGWLGAKERATDTTALTPLVDAHIICVLQPNCLLDEKVKALLDLDSGRK
ncbi:hypothetical protein, partial [Cellulomonas bogoriensis]|uniref:hypothetical protein n=1 Tax=Cellulomonas bogoriensis TaxID=301388 RepID=UPI00054EBB66